MINPMISTRTRTATLSQLGVHAPFCEAPSTPRAGSLTFLLGAPLTKAARAGGAPQQLTGAPHMGEPGVSILESVDID
jgi:hypothetical protein